MSEFPSLHSSYNRSGITGWRILQFTTHILDTQPMDRIRYRNRTRLKNHFHAINIDKELARQMDGRGGTIAVSGMSALSFTHLGFALVLVCATKSTRAAVVLPNFVDVDIPGYLEYCLWCKRNNKTQFVIITRERSLI